MLLDSDKEDLVDQIKLAVGQALNLQKDRMAERLSAVAKAMEDTGRTLDRHNGTAARYAQTWAAKVEGLAGSVKDRSAGQWVSEAEDFARRQPGLFVGTAVAAGFVLAKLLRGGTAPPQPDRAEPAPPAGEVAPMVPGDPVQHLSGQPL